MALGPPPAPPNSILIRCYSTSSKAAVLEPHRAHLVCRRAAWFGKARVRGSSIWKGAVEMPEVCDVHEGSRLDVVKSREDLGTSVAREREGTRHKAQGTMSPSSRGNPGIG